MDITKTALVILIASVFLCAPLVHADTGPSPPQPNVTVHMVAGGKPALTVSEITYDCMGETTDDHGAVTQRVMTLACAGGTCTNAGGWFYKFNPCFGFPGGRFTYDYNGSSAVSEELNTTGNFTKYDITIDAPSGHVISSFGTSIPAGCCGSAFVLAAIAAGAVFVRRG